jgi:hypothetical protein
MAYLHVGHRTNRRSATTKVKHQSAEGRSNIFFKVVGLAAMAASIVLTVLMWKYPVGWIFFAIFFVAMVLMFLKRPR